MALQAGAVDMIVTDWPWVARQRSEGAAFSFVPYSKAVGTLIVPRNSSIANPADLKGRRIGVVGGIGQKPLVPRSWRWLTNPPVATLLHGAALWIWHAPALYEAALADSWIHWLQHLSFFATAILFWRALLQGREQAYGPAVFYLFVTSLHTGFLGILLAFLRQPVYPTQTSAAPEWGLTPLEDQQLAGLFMWIPAGIVYAGVALILAGLWISRSGTARLRGGHVYETR